SAAPARPTRAPAMSTRHSSTAPSWSSCAGAPCATTVRSPSRSERSATGPSARLCTEPGAAPSVSTLTSSSSSSPSTIVATEPAEGLPQRGVEPVGPLRRPDDGGWALLEEERAEGLDELLLLVAEREVHRLRRARRGRARRERRRHRRPAPHHRPVRILGDAI